MLQREWLEWNDTFGEIIEDLALVSDETERIHVSGETKNLERLADLPTIDAVAISRFSQQQMEDVARLDSLKELALHGFRGTSCEALTSLSKLIRLEFSWASKIEAVNPVGSLTNLRHLLVGEMRRVVDFEALSSLTRLHDLSIVGPTSLSYAQPILTLEPLTSLVGLQHLDLGATKIMDGGLAPLARMPWLKSLWVPNVFQIEELARLSVHLHDTDCPLFRPWMTGPELNGRKTVMLTGKPARLIYTDDPALERLQAVRKKKFEKACAAARQET